MSYQIKHYQLNIFVKYSLWIFFSSINFTFVVGNYRENHALRHPCNSINKRLVSYITWTEKLASSQYKGELLQLFFMCQDFDR